MAVDAVVGHVQQSVPEPGVNVRRLLGQNLTRLSDPVDMFCVLLPILLSLLFVIGSDEMLIV